MTFPAILQPPEESAFERRAPDQTGDAVVEDLLRQRARGWMEHWSWPLLRPILYRMLGYRRAVEMTDAIHEMSGIEAIRWVSGVLQMQLTCIHRERIPETGPVFIVCNHPTSIADGIVIDDSVRPARPDLVYFANSDAFRVVPRFDEFLIPVEWEESKRNRQKTKETLKLALQAVESAAAIAIFPAGRIAKYRDGVLEDPAWESTAVTLARRKDVPILPVHMTGRSSRLYHLADKISEPLRDMTLFREMLVRKGRKSRVTFGPLITPDRLKGDPDEVTARLKTYVETILPEDPDASFD